MEFQGPEFFPFELIGMESHSATDSSHLYWMYFNNDNEIGFDPQVIAECRMGYSDSSVIQIFTSPGDISLKTETGYALLADLKFLNRDKEPYEILVDGVITKQYYGHNRGGIIRRDLAHSGLFKSNEYKL